ncbi:MAG: hypothetical protein RL662_1993 [Bacteroidota bacterium]|jgi:ABC-2 type transport system ATP-binding protein
MNILEINKLNIEYGSKKVLKNLDLNIAKGTVHGLIGSNGAGKTTLFNCINSNIYNRCNIKYSVDTSIGYLPAEIWFYPYMKGIEYIELSLTSRKIKINYKYIEILNSMFDLPLEEYATNYSTGMKKRLVIMSILLQKNNFFTLDEPFNGLDLSSSLILNDIILKLKSKGYTTLISSHIISSLLELCDFISFLDEGCIKKTYEKKEFHIIEHDIKNFSVIDKTLLFDTII